ncbi:MAG: hypothetical protein PHV32_17710, partial [Eubacteriales bacterium]|nr:hypothetical protein [Eubacteriales bacterium]
TLHNKAPIPDTGPETSVTDTTKDVVIETLETTDTSDVEVSAACEIIDDGNALKPDENVTDSSDSKTTGEKAKETVSTVQEADPPKNEDESDNGGGIQIGGGETETKYSCGSPNHHCDGPETHAYILNLELQGCPYCGSHSCPSFYAVDEWGNACYTPSKCPKYDITKDPVYYCQVCGRKNGNGDNNTCQKWIVDTVCPICGKLVKANECHTH